MGRKVELAIGIVNGAVGDYLQRSKNGLATTMTWVVDGTPLPLIRQTLNETHPQATPKVTVLVHGLMCTEEHWKLRDGSTYGCRLAQDLGYTPFILRYNSGLPIPENGRELSKFLQTLLSIYPSKINELLLVGFSMGGLVVRSACHVATTEDQAWLQRVSRVITIGTPHRGAPLERFARTAVSWLRAIPDPYTRLIATLSDLRSDGLKDLGDADIRHRDRARRRPSISPRDPTHPVPLLSRIKYYLAAGSIFQDPRLSALFGDVMVPVASATDGNCTDAESIAFPPRQVKVFPGIGHMELPRHPAVYEQIRSWCQEEI